MGITWLYKPCYKSIMENLDFSKLVIRKWLTGSSCTYWDICSEWRKLQHIQKFAKSAERHFPIRLGSFLFESKVTIHPLDLGSILIFQRFRRISVRINSRDFTMHICKRHRQYPALEKYLFYPAHDYAHIYVFTLAIVRIISQYSSRLYK